MAHVTQIHHPHDSHRPLGWSPHTSLPLDLAQSHPHWPEFHSLNESGSFLPQHLPSARKTAPHCYQAAPTHLTDFSQISLPLASSPAAMEILLSHAPSEHAVQFPILLTCVLTGLVLPVLTQAINSRSPLSMAFTTPPYPVPGIESISNKYWLHDWRNECCLLYNMLRFSVLICNTMTMKISLLCAPTTWQDK